MAHQLLTPASFSPSPALLCDMLTQVASVFLSCGVAVATWHEMPSGASYHADCIHQFDEDFHVEHLADGRARVTFAAEANREELMLPPCAHEPRTSVQATAKNDSRQAARYYSDWVASTQTVRKEGFGFMSSAWRVPANPTSRGPFPPLVESSIYFFNGLENSNGVPGTADVILQPVLQFGKSGCLLNPLKFGAWYFTAYQVGINGRAFCGRNVGPLREGDVLVGNMTLTDAKTNTWDVTAARASTGEVSSHSVGLGNRTLDAAYITLEAMVIYSCAAFPASGSLAFENNSLAGIDGSTFTPAWEKKLYHTECSQDVQMPSSPSDPVRLFWDAKMEHESNVVILL